MTISRVSGWSIVDPVHRRSGDYGGAIDGAVPSGTGTDEKQSWFDWLLASVGARFYVRLAMRCFGAAIRGGEIKCGGSAIRSERGRIFVSRGDAGDRETDVGL